MNKHLKKNDGNRCALMQYSLYWLACRTLLAVKAIYCRMLEKYREVSSSIHKWGQSLGQIDSELPSGPYNCHHTPFSTRPHCGDVEEPKDGTTGRRLLAAQKD